MRLLENISPKIKRRFPTFDFDEIIKTVIEYTMPAVESYPTVGEFVAEVCDVTKDYILDEIDGTTPSDRDEFYYYLVDRYGKYLSEYFYENVKLDEQLSRMKSMMISEAKEVEVTEMAKYEKSSQPLQDVIHHYLNQYFNKAERQIRQKSRNYGSLGETWCFDGNETILANYYFENGKFNTGVLLVDRSLVSTIQKLFSVRMAYVLYIIEEWYDDTMVPEFESIVGMKGLSIDRIDIMTNMPSRCFPAPVKPEGITDQEMIDFIVKNTLYKEKEVLKKLESGEEELEEFYLQIVDIVNRR